MATDIYLSIFSPDFQENRVPTQAEWEAVLTHIPNLKIEEDGYEIAIKTYAEELSDWVPVFWIAEELVYMKATPFFNFEEVHNKGIEIAYFLKACIWCDDEILYLPIDEGPLENPVNLEEIQTCYQKHKDKHPNLEQLLQLMEVDKKEETYNPIQQTYEMKLKTQVGCGFSTKMLLMILLLFSLYFIF